MSSGTMKSRTEALAIARSYIGTPYVLGGRVKGAGVDCATLLAEYLMEIGATTEAELIEAGFYREGGVVTRFRMTGFVTPSGRNICAG
jgi:hypothetical protein